LRTDHNPYCRKQWRGKTGLKGISLTKEQRKIEEEKGNSESNKNGMRSKREYGYYSSLRPRGWYATSGPGQKKNDVVKFAKRGRKCEPGERKNAKASRDERPSSAKHQKLYPREREQKPHSNCDGGGENKRGLPEAREGVSKKGRKANQWETSQQ